MKRHTHPRGHTGRIHPTRLAWAGFLLAVALVMPACNESPTASVHEVESVNGISGSGTTGSSTDLTSQEVQDLTFLREEEKLARDVYTALHDQWGLRVHGNIAESEQRHTDAVLALLEQFDLDDPAEGKSPGEFTNPELQGLHDALVERGGISAAEALRVGGLIEEVDILDLEAMMARTDNEVLAQVYAYLLQGSHHHLRAFSRVYASHTGEIYEPVHLSPKQYEAILSESSWAGRGAGRRQGGRLR